MKKGFIKKYIQSHWELIGRKTKVFVRRNYKVNTILIDFMGGGSCTLYDYNGKYITG